MSNLKYQMKPMNKEDLFDRVLNFSVDIIKIVNRMPKTPAGFKIGAQVVASATSIGANTQEAQGASSRLDFINKMNIAFKEAKETKFWLTLIKKSQLLPASLVENELKESDELCAIYSAILKSAKNKMSNAKSKMLNVSGFTLIEIMVVISIIAVISTFGLNSYQTASHKARDGVRKNNLNQLSTALGIYFQKHSKYIAGYGTCAGDTPVFKNNISSFMSGNTVPKDPVTAADYCYIGDPTGKTFRLFAKLENIDVKDPNYIDCSDYNWTLTSDNLTNKVCPSGPVASNPSPPPPIIPPPPPPTSGASWTENWDSMSEVQGRWDTAGDNCYSIPQPGILDLNCQSSGLTSKQYFDKSQPITVTGAVRAQPKPGSTTDAFWGGLTLYNNNGADNNYGEIAAERNVSPYGGDHSSRIVSLTNDIGANLSSYSPWSWRNFKIAYDPSTGKYDYYLDGTKFQTTLFNAALTANPDIFVLCASVGTGTGNDGSSAECQFGPIAVTGTLASAPPPPTAKRVFVTKNWVNGNINGGGLAGADTWCQSQANQASLGGSFKAWLSDGQTSAASRLAHYNGPYKLVDNTTIVANNWADLTDGSIASQINKDQFGADANGIITWTNTNADGSITGNNCGNWASTSGTGNTGHTGLNDSQWTKFGSNSCSEYKALYCLEQ